MLRTLGCHEFQHLVGQSLDYVTRTFGNGRAFTVLKTWEYGVVVFDTDARCIIVQGPDLDGDSAASEAATAEFKLVKKMRWPAFSKFCREHRFYVKGIASDIDAGRPPRSPDLLNQGILDGKYPGRGGADIRTDLMVEEHATPNGRYRFDHKTREDMIVFLACHHRYEIGVRPVRICIAWDVKIDDDRDMTGKGGPAPTDPLFDERWAAWVDQNYTDLFWRACAKAARKRFGDLRPTSLPASDRAARFEPVGTQMGHVILTSWGGPVPLPRRSTAMSFDGSGHYIEWLRALKNSDLARLYRLVTVVDRDIDDRLERFAEEINSIRATMERKWRREVSSSSAKPLAVA